MNRLLAVANPAIPAILVLGLFVWFANWIPQTRWQPPEKRVIESASSPAQLAELGKTIVRERGCMACHTMEAGTGIEGAGRGPNLFNIAARRAGGIEGGPDNLVDYLVQALYQPSAHVVEGYTDIMPPSTGAPAKLSYEEITAVVNYLQSLGDTPGVKIGDLPRPSGEPATEPAAESQAAVTDPAKLLEATGCLACHSQKSGEVKLGPPLDPAGLEQAAARRDMSVVAYLLESIVQPAAFERQGFPAGAMPTDYGDKLSAGQLNAMINYLTQGGKAR